MADSGKDMNKEELELISKIIRSVGNHRKYRLLSPIEVAEGIKHFSDKGFTKPRISDLIKLNVSMIDKFLKLIDINDSHRHLVDWGGGGKASIAFSSASEISRLERRDQEILIPYLLKYQITKYEVQQIIQIRTRSSAEIKKCVDDVLKMRPNIVKKSVFVGTIADEHLAEILGNMSQSERDSLLQRAIVKTVASGTEWSGRLGKNNFSLVGGEIFSKQLLGLKPNFEAYFAKVLHGLAHK